MELDDAQIEKLADLLVDSHDQLLSELIATRKKHGLSQEKVAERMGVSQPSVAAFERYDANPGLSTIRRYALAVQASIEHRVVDQCCIRLSQVPRNEVDEPSRAPISWGFGRPLGWDWPAGPTTIKARVDV